ncbi:AlpA Predicted transcriptional regulator [uncultured Caudovirales phage]|uniref:AlpA Predicted transcriptional regulator n=1 Tax=uncultured Caudovirales phage TaxID=2100421 RepID=A0A6J5LQZ8_9CAUD|nr:AlpA Predicted transcriptional regulator [uncultured Caudovirales phage]CAB4134089.1 AlpA Predicted transcriptional regulator [uncultured Caudovirales phage]
MLDKSSKPMEIAQEKPYRLLRLPDVIHRCGFGKSTLWRLVSEGKFPKPVRPSSRTTAWIDKEVDSWIEEKMKSR